jgi:mannose-6-phosphate isomerase-like protein (cupin superfamily)
MPIERRVSSLIIHSDTDQEYFFQEGCYILELSNSVADPELSIARARVQQGVTTRRHRLKGITERYVIQEGEGMVEIGDQDAVQVRTGDVVIIPPGEHQRIVNTGSGDLVFLALCTPRFERMAYEDTQPEAQ